MLIEQFKSMQDWEQCWAAQKSPTATTLLIFKHSPICPISHTVKAEFLRFVAGLSELNSQALRVVEVDVVGQRPMARRISDDIGIRHESPQALLFGKSGAVSWNASHDDITVRSLTDALAVVQQSS